MKKQEKKVWEAPKVQSLSVKEITLSGAEYSPNEEGGKDRPGPQGS